VTAATNRETAELQRRYPEWSPWLAVIEQVLREAADAKWEALVPKPPAPQEMKVPLLSGAALNLEPAVVGAWSQRLLRSACQSGAPKMAALQDGRLARLEAGDLFKPALCQNWQALRAIATELGVDADALQAVAALVPVPFLQACHRRWRPSLSQSWSEGYCFVCGAWPILAEVRGIERSRYLRCGRCGASWQSRCLCCCYCGMTDHEELVSLVPEKSGANAVIEACKRCHGYVKTFSTLQGSAPIKVMVDDLASVDLDIAALELGYRRPAGAGYALDVTIASQPNLSNERIASWNS
jgi:FdhE protein